MFPNHMIVTCGKVDVHMAFGPQVRRVDRRCELDNEDGHVCHFFYMQACSNAVYSNHQQDRKVMYH